jgi:hypothetical protein
MKNILAFICILCCFATNAQITIAGQVYDEPEKKPLEGAYVYLDGTTFSASTDKKGSFRLVLPQQYNAPLIISFVGFETLHIENPLQYAGKTMKLYMREDAAELDEVVINPRFSRRQMLAAFRNQFLGSGKVGRNCRIENEDDIYVFYDEERNVLRAKCRVPLRILNKSLEYKVLFDLAGFEATYNGTTLDDARIRESYFAGSTSFTDISVSGSADKKRRESFEGSLTHLMRTIRQGDWARNKFGLYLNSFPVDPSRFIKTTDTLSMKKVTLNEKELEGYAPSVSTNLLEKVPVYKRVPFSILYNADTNKQSMLRFKQSSFYIDDNGLFVPIDAFVVSGYMGSLKAGDMLPADYHYTP